MNGRSARHQLININGDTAGLAYDGNGNQTAHPGAGDVPAHTATWTVRDQLAALTTSTETVGFGYTGPSNDQRLTITTGTSTTGVQNSMLGVTATTTGGTTVGYLRTPDGQLIGRDLPNLAPYYYLTDHQGSVVALVDASGNRIGSYTYDPNGNLRNIQGTAATDNPYRYTGGHYDTETGLYKLGYRYYDPTTGRFTQPDPSGQEQNPYLYAAGNPINYVDPTGLYTSIFSFSVCRIGCLGVEFSLDSAGRYGFGVKAGIGIGGGFEASYSPRNLSGSAASHGGQCGIGRLAYSTSAVTFTDYSARVECSYTGGYTWTW